MKIQDILKDKGSRIWMVKSNQTVREAMALLVRQHIGAVLVADGDFANVVGILTERDIVRASFDKRSDINEDPVSLWMSRRIVTTTPEASVQEVMELMTEKRVRHIPVVDHDSLQGIVSIGDIVKALLESSDHEIKSLKEYMYGSLYETA